LRDEYASATFHPLFMAPLGVCSIQPTNRQMAADACKRLRGCRWLQDCRTADGCEPAGRQGCRAAGLQMAANGSRAGGLQTAADDCRAAGEGWGACKQRLQAVTASSNCKQQLQAAVASSDCKQRLQAAIASSNCKQQLQAGLWTLHTNATATDRIMASRNAVFKKQAPLFDR